MSPVVKAVLAGIGVGLGVAAASVLLKSSSATGANRLPNTASAGRVGVGYISPGSGTRDWWHDRNARRRNKHLKLMTAKG